MPYYPDDIVEEVRAGNDIIDIISGYVRLTRKGNSYFGLCPFHSEKSPSFSVVPGKQMYYCFGCGAGGNVFTFLMQYENFTFAEAVETLATRANITLPKSGYGAAQKAMDDRKTKLLAVQKDAAKYYYMLLRSERGKRAIDYFKGRRLTEETMRRFGLGYSDQYSGSLYSYLRKLGYEDELLRDSGLVSFDEKRGGYDKFWNRAMFPIMDIHGKVIGFGGRVMGDAKPKYLNSPETPIFDKSRNLYGLNIARKTRRTYLLLCEGYMDVIALHQAGFDNAVASLGTALTPGHAVLLSRYTKEVCLTYDSDGAGVKAALRAIPILQEAGIAAKIVNMQPSKDPDEFIGAFGAAAYEERILQAENSFLFEIRILEQQYDLDDPQGKTQFYNETARRLCAFSEKLERDNYIEAVAAKYRIATEDLKKLVNRYGGAMSREGGLYAAGKPKDTRFGKAAAEQKKEDGFKQSQKLLLTWLIQEDGLFLRVRKYISPEDFTEELYQKAAKLLYEQYDRNGSFAPAQIVSMFAKEEEQREIAGMFHSGLKQLKTPEEKEKALWDTVIRIKGGSIRRRSKTIPPSDLDGMMKLVEDKRQLEELERLH